MAQGSIRKLPRKRRDGTVYHCYQARIPLPPDPVTGKRRSLAETLPTKKQAEAWVTRQLGKLLAGELLAPERMTVDDLLDRWLPLHARDVEANTVYSDRWAAQHIRAHLGSIDLHKLTVLRVQAFYDALNATLQPSSIKNVHRVLNQALDQAVAWEVIARNPAKATRRPAVTPPEQHPWTAQQCIDFLDATREDQDGPLYALILATGMRIGEALALRWEDVDIDAGRLMIQRTMTRNERGYRVVGEKTKTRTSRRPILLPDPALAALWTQLGRQDVRRLKAGALWDDDGFVFDNGNGAQRDPGGARGRFRRVVERSGLPPLTPHGLRHTVATYLFRRRVPAKLIQDLLGHAKVEITLNLYAHLVDDDRGDLAKEIEAVFWESGAPRVHVLELAEKSTASGSEE